MQCACAMLSSVACPALHCFSTSSHRRHEFRKKKSLPNNDKKSILIFIKNIRHFCHILKKLEVSQQNLEKNSNIEFRDKNRVVVPNAKFMFAVLEYGCNYMQLH
jgi:thioredoxin-related protein